MRIAVAGATGLVGRYVVEYARQRNHAVIELSRSLGVDLRTGSGLEARLDGADVILDVTNSTGPDRRDAHAFFTDVARTLQSVGASRQVRHLVTLSIVGIDRAPENSYYAAKLQQELITLQGPVSATVLRATQFHEFPVQMLLRNREGTRAHVPRMRVQTVAARTVAEALVNLAEGPALGPAPDLGGPEQAELVVLARQYAQHFGLQLTIEEAAGDATVPYGATLPSAGARLEGPTFAEWLETDDAARLLG